MLRLTLKSVAIFGAFLAILGTTPAFAQDGGGDPCASMDLNALTNQMILDQQNIPLWQSQIIKMQATVAQGKASIDKSVQNTIARANATIPRLQTQIAASQARLAQSTSDAVRISLQKQITTLQARLTSTVNSLTTAPQQAEQRKQALDASLLKYVNKKTNDINNATAEVLSIQQTLAQCSGSQTNTGDPNNPGGDPAPPPGTGDGGGGDGG